MAAASLLIRIAADTGNLKSGITAATRELDRLQESAAATGKRMLSVLPASIGKEAKNIAGAVGGLVGAFGGLGGAMAALGVGTLANDFLDTSGALVDLSAQTDITIRDLQRFKFAGEQVGVSLDSITTAVSQLQNRLGSGDKSAFASLDALGLSLQQLQKLDPGQQFELIATGLSKITDANTRAAIAQDLFGRGFITLMPLLRSNLKDVGDQAAVVSDRTVIAADKFDDMFGRIKNFGKGVIAEGVFGPIVRWADDVSLAVDGATNSFHALRGAMDTLPALPSVPAGFGAVRGAPALTMTPEEQRRIEDDLDRSLKHQRDAIAAAAKQAADTWRAEVKAISDAISGATVVRDLKQWAEALRAPGAAGKVLADEGLRRELGGAIDVINLKFGSLKAAGLGSLTGMADALKAVGQFAETIPPALTETMSTFPPLAEGVRDFSIANAETTRTLQDMIAAGDVLGRRGPKTFSDLKLGAVGAREEISKLGLAFSNLGSTIVGAIQGGGKIGASIFSSLGQGLGSDLGGKLATAIGGTFGKTLGGMLGPLGAIAGNLIGGLFDKIFSKAGRNTVEQFAASLGGFDALRTKLNDLGEEGERLWVNLTQRVGKGNVEQAKSAIAAIESALEAHKAKTTQISDDIVASQHAQTAAIEQATSGVRSRISDLSSEYDRLFTSIENEAPEAVMGDIERMTRDRMAAVASERRNAENELELITNQMQASFESVADAAVVSADIIRRAFEDMIPNREIQTFGGTSSLALGDSGGQAVVPLGAGAAPSTAPIVTQVYLDGRQIAEASAPHLSRFIRRTV